MKKNSFLVFAGVLFALSLSWGETVTATSNSFQFPSFDAIRNTQGMGFSSHYLRFSRASLKSNKVIFSWAMPASRNDEIGALSIYSLLGRKIRAFSLTSRAGSLVWQMNPSEALAGVYIVRFVLGANKYNLKLALSK